jgi:hypothetical protein
MSSVKSEGCALPERFESGSKIRAIGARHSFNGIADSPGDLLDLSSLDPEFSIGWFLAEIAGLTGHIIRSVRAQLPESHRLHGNATGSERPVIDHQENEAGGDRC